MPKLWVHISDTLMIVVEMMVVPWGTVDTFRFFHGFGQSFEYLV